MSAGTPRDAAAVRERAEALRDLLAPACERVEIAGSLRRGAPEVHDIEIVAMPRFAAGAPDLWGEPGPSVDLLAALLDGLAASGALTVRPVEVHRADGGIEVQTRRGDRYQALSFGGAPVDLFVVRPPADWGVVMTIRTGPADWSRELVTRSRERFLIVTGGHLVYHSSPVPCPEERDFLDALGQPWVEPSERSAARVRLRPRGLTP